MLGNLKTSFNGTFHAFDFYKYARRYLGGYCFRFNIPFSLLAITEGIANAFCCCILHGAGSQGRIHFCFISTSIANSSLPLKPSLIYGMQLELVAGTNKRAFFVIAYYSDYSVFD
jgi:hypothetical protein